jgi:hypothetical protein
MAASRKGGRWRMDRADRWSMRLEVMGGGRAGYRGDGEDGGSRGRDASREASRGEPRDPAKIADSHPVGWTFIYRLGRRARAFERRSTFQPLDLDLDRPDAQQRWRPVHAVARPAGGARPVGHASARRAMSTWCVSLPIPGSRQPWLVARVANDPGPPFLLHERDQRPHLLPT